MNKILKKPLSLLLAFLMCFTMLPMTTFAVGGNEITSAVMKNTGADSDTDVNFTSSTPTVTVINDGVTPQNYTAELSFNLTDESTGNKVVITLPAGMAWVDDGVTSDVADLLVGGAATTAPCPDAAQVNTDFGYTLKGGSKTYELKNGTATFNLKIQVARDPAVHIASVADAVKVELFHGATLNDSASLTVAENQELATTFASGAISNNVTYCALDQPTAKLSYSRKLICFAAASSGNASLSPASVMVKSLSVTLQLDNPNAVIGCANGGNVTNNGGGSFTIDYTLGKPITNLHVLDYTVMMPDASFDAGDQVKVTCTDSEVVYWTPTGDRTIVLDNQAQFLNTFQAVPKVADIYIGSLITMDEAQNSTDSTEAAFDFPVNIAVNPKMDAAVARFGLFNRGGADSADKTAEFYFDGATESSNATDGVFGVKGLYMPLEPDKTITTVSYKTTKQSGNNWQTAAVNLTGEASGYATLTYNMLGVNLGTDGYLSALKYDMGVIKAARGYGKNSDAAYVATVIGSRLQDGDGTNSLRVYDGSVDSGTSVCTAKNTFDGMYGRITSIAPSRTTASGTDIEGYTMTYFGYSHVILLNSPTYNPTIYLRVEAVDADGDPLKLKNIKITNSVLGEIPTADLTITNEIVGGVRIYKITSDSELFFASGAQVQGNQIKESSITLGYDIVVPNGTPSQSKFMKDMIFLELDTTGGVYTGSAQAEGDPFGLSSGGKVIYPGSSLSNITYTIELPESVVVSSAGKSNKADDAAFGENTVIPVSDFDSADVRVTFMNNTGHQVNMAPSNAPDAFFIVPQKDKEYGDLLTPDGAFKFTMNLNSAPTVPLGFTVKYLTVADLNAAQATLADYDTEAQVAALGTELQGLGWTDSFPGSGNVGAIRFSYTKLPTGKTNIDMNMSLLSGQDGLVEHDTDVMKPIYYSVNTAGSSWTQADNMVYDLAMGAIAGQLFHDADGAANGKFDTGEQMGDGGWKVELYDVTDTEQKAMLTAATTNSFGQYVISGIYSDMVYTVKVTNQSSNRMFTMLGTVNAKDNWNTDNQVSAGTDLTTGLMERVYPCSSSGLAALNYTTIPAKYNIGVTASSKFTVAFETERGQATLNGNSGTQLSETGYPGTALKLKNPANVAGYTFDGWYVKGDATQTIVTPITKVGYADVTYVAKWTAQSATATVTISADDAVYDGTAKTPAPVVKVGDTTLTSDQYVTVYSDNVNVGTATVKVYGIGEYAGLTASTTFAITKATQTVAFVIPSPSALTYAPGLTFNNTATSNFGNAITYSVVSGPATVSATTGEVSITGAGTVVVKAAAAASTPAGNYDAADKTYSLTVNKATPVLYFDNSTVSVKTTDTVSNTLNTIPTGLTGITYASSDPTVATVNTNTGAVTLLKAGSTTITASYPGNANYTTASDSYALTVADVSNQIAYTVADYIGTYDGSAHGATVTATVPANATITYGANGNSFTNAGTYTVSYTIKAAGYETVTGTAKVIINKAPLTDATVATGSTYTGSAITPAVSAIKADSLNVANTNCTINYINNINAGTGTVIITANASSNYTGTLVKSFTIAPKTLTEAMVSTIADQAYTSSQITPDVTVTDGSALKEGKDFDVAYGTNVDVATDGGSATITGTGNYTGSVIKKFNIVNDGTFTVIVDQSAQTYDGNEKKPAVLVYAGDTLLTADTDYTVKYTDNKNAGTATVTVEGKGNYDGYTDAVEHFTIDKAEKTLAFADATVNKTYGDSKFTKSATLTPNDLAGITYVSSDPSVATVNSATGEVTILKVGTTNIVAQAVATGNYLAAEGSYKLNVEPKDIADVVFDAISDQTYTGTEIKPGVSSAAEGSLLTANDYFLTYTDNTDKGTATITVHGIGNYTGTQDVEFEITAKTDATDMTVAPIPNQTWTGSPIEPSVTVKDGDGKTLTVGKDYTVSYKNNTDLGTADAIIHFIGNYEGTTDITENFQIVFKSTDVTLTFDANTANGGASAPDKLTVSKGTILSLTMTATPDSTHIFNGWFDAATGGNKLSSITMDANKTIYAQYTEIPATGKFTVTFDKGTNGSFTNDPDALAAQQITAGETVVSFPEITADSNYTFLGWQLDGTGDVFHESAIKLIPVTDNVNYVAAYEKTGNVATMVTLTFDANGGSDAPSAITMEEGTIWGLAGYTVTPPVGFKFVGWTLNGSDVTSVTLDANKTVKAKFEKIKSYTVTFDVGADGNLTGDDTYSITEGDKITTVPTVTEKDPTAKKFLGWTLSGDTTIYTADAIKGITIDGNKAFTASYSDITPATNYFTLTFDKGAGVSAPSAVTLPEGTVFDLGAYTAEPQVGHVFKEWIDSNNAPITSFDFSKDETVTATYDVLPAPTEYEVKFFDADNNQLGTTEMVTENDFIATVPTAPAAPAGKVFVGWNNGTNTVPANLIQLIPVTADVSYTAVYQEKPAVTTTATLKFDTNGSTSTFDDITTVTGTVLNVSGYIPNAPANMVFIGWKDENGAMVTSVTMDSNKTVTAQYSVVNPAGPFTVTFNAGTNGAMTPATYSETVNGGASVSSVPGIAANSSYTFLGWTKNGSTTKYSDADVLAMQITADTTFTAAYQKTTTSGGSGSGSGITNYSLSFQENGGTAITPVSATSGTTIDLGKYTTTRHGYTFKGWYTDKGLTEKATSIKLTRNTVVYAKWTLNAPMNTEDHVAYVAGYIDGTVKPNAKITRAETAMMLYRLLTDSRRAEISTTRNSFSDMNSGLWYNQAVSTMTNGGYISGYADGTFGGNKTITRAEFVTMLVRFIGVDNSASADFSDVSKGHWAYQYIATASSNGWVSGYSNDSFGADQAITRAEAVAIINRVLGRGVDADSDLLNFKAFPDNNNSGAWYYYEIIEASNTHDYTGSRPSEDWTSISK